jgi:hypothetical protein
MVAGNRVSVFPGCAGIDMTRWADETQLAYRDIPLSGDRGRTGLIFLGQRHTDILWQIFNPAIFGLLPT